MKRTFYYVAKETDVTLYEIQNNKLVQHVSIEIDNTVCPVEMIKVVLLEDSEMYPSEYKLIEL